MARAGETSEFYHHCVELAPAAVKLAPRELRQSPFKEGMHMC